MALDPTIPLGVKPPDVAGSISKWGELGLLRNRIELSNATLQPSITQAQAQASTAVTNTEQAKFNLTRDQAGAAFSASGTLATHPAIVQLTQLAGQPDFKATLAQPGTPAHEAVNQSLIALGAAQRQAESMGLPPQMADVMFGRLRAMAENDPRGLQAMLIQNLKVAQGPGASAQQMFPAPQILNTGQVAQPIAAGNPALTGVPAGAPQGMATQMEVPVTQPVMRNGVPGVLGVARNQLPGGSNIQTGPALGQVEATQGRVLPNVKFYADVQAAAAAAPRRITQLQEIKSLAPQAVTGDANFKRQVFSKLAGYLGVVFDPTSQTATDELVKATAQLMDRAGATDAAREVAAMATPNYKMTKEAINTVSSALIGLEKSNLAASKYFSGIPQDGQEFDKRFQTWNNIPARDKAFMFMSLPVDEKTAAAQKMRGTPQGKEIAAGIRAIEALGLK
jgi:hypothetical protein